MKQNTTHAIFGILVILFTCNANAQDWKTEKKVNVLFGLSQPIIASGFNIEGNYIHNRLIFDYSHGASLDFKGNTLTDELRAQHVVVHEPWTTGFGVGYRIKEWVNIRVEPKWHKFEFYYENDAQKKGNEITSYNTFSLGLGMYFAYQPFKKSDNLLKGIMISPSIRYWPTLSSSLNDDNFTYNNKTTGKSSDIKTLDPGLGFTPFVFNVSVGYSFKLK